jgi:hypothetical protein
MNKSSIKVLGKGLQREYLIPETLPVSIQNALRALAEKQPEAAPDQSLEAPQKKPSSPDSALGDGGSRKIAPASP